MFDLTTIKIQSKLAELRKNHSATGIRKLGTFSYGTETGEFTTQYLVIIDDNFYKVDVIELFEKEALSEEDAYYGVFSKTTKTETVVIRPLTEQQAREEFFNGGNVDEEDFIEFKKP